MTTDIPSRLLFGHGGDVFAGDSEQRDPAHDLGVKANPILRNVHPPVDENVFLQGTRVIDDQLLVRLHSLRKRERRLRDEFTKDKTSISSYPTTDSL